MPRARKPKTPASATLAARASRGRISRMIVLSPEHDALLEALATARGVTKSAVVAEALALLSPPKLEP